jgi:hypothetical protein
MRTQTSVFNLIEIFTKAKRSINKMVSPKEHCEREQFHDFYCETKG